MVLREGLRSAEIPSSRIGTATFIPEYNVANEELAHYFKQVGITTGGGSDVTPQRIEELTGIESRHWVNELGAKEIKAREDVVPFMARGAAIEAIENDDLNGVDVILTSTTIPFGKSLFSSLAADLDVNLGRTISTREAIGGDIYAACTGTAWAFHYLKENDDEMLGKRVLIVASEYISPTLNDLNSSLFSDGAAALAFVYGEDLEVLASSAKVFPDTERYIRFPINEENLPQENVLYFVPTASPDESQEFNKEENLSMRYGQLEGRTVFEFALREVPPMIGNALKKAGVDVKSAFVILHQANGRINTGIGNRLEKFGVDKNNVYSNIRYHGNTSSVSMLIAMDEAGKNGLIRRGSIVVLAGFGAGMSAAVAVVRIN